jgi:hypothetical protein
MNARPGDCEPEPRRESRLSRVPVVVVGVLVLFASAIWLSCQEYDAGGPNPAERAPAPPAAEPPPPPVEGASETR